MSQLRIEDLPVSVQLVESNGGVVFRYIDERALPGKLEMAETADWQAVVDAVKTLAVRGAPAIGLAGASALALWAQEHEESFSHDELVEAARQIASTRPTAVNLKWAIDRSLACIANIGKDDVTSALVKLVKDMELEDERVNRAIGSHGAALLEKGSRVLTHCNAGSLATFHYGTALGIVYTAFEQGRIERVYADETRPVGQGARLTAWELSRTGVPVTLICDNMAASLMAKGEIDAVIVGADRIASNGDVANKIGTYSVAVLARAHGIPFYVAAPSSTLDLTLDNGTQIPIEQRDVREVQPVPIAGVDVYNPAFDITPARLISAIITEQGVFAPDALKSAI